MEITMLYITCADAAEANRIGRLLVEERLAACVNILDGMTSVYWWEGQVQDGHETVLIAKTRAAHVDAVIARVRELHSYDCPCVVSWPITKGNPDYLEWIAKESDPNADRPAHDG